MAKYYTFWPRLLGLSGSLDLLSSVNLTEYDDNFWPACAARVLTLECTQYPRIEIDYSASIPFHNSDTGRVSPANASFHPFLKLS